MDLTILDKQIFERFIRPSVNKKTQYVGVEFELPLVNLKHAPVDFAVVHTLVDAFLEHFGFVPVAWDDEGAVCSAQSEENGDDLSFDCSYNTLELSFGRVRDLNRIEERFHSYYRFIRAFLRRHGHSITGMGINPRYLYNHREPVPNGRYRMLLNHLNSYERYKVRMVFHNLPFFGLMACSSQTHIDVNRDELLRVLDIYNRLEPLKALLFANSPYGGEYLCARDSFWRCSMHGVNPHNVDGWDYGVSSIEELVAYIRSMSLFCTERDGKYLNFPPTPLVDYFNSESVTGEYWDGNGYKTFTFTPRLEDLKYLRSYKNVDLTFRGTVELRSACMQPVSEIMTVPAFDLGCKESMDELEALLHQSKLYQQGYSPSELRELFVRRGLPGFVDREKLRHLLEQVVALAEQGLKKRGLGEEHMLAPLKERARRLSSPALELVEGLQQGRSIEDYIEAYGRLEG